MLTDKQRQAILDQNDNDPTLQKYIRKVFEAAPNLENSVHIEGLAIEWNKAVEFERWTTLTFSDIVSRYRRTYAEEARIAKKAGHEMPPLELDLSMPEGTYQINEEMTANAIETQKKTGNLLEALKMYQETGALFDPDDDIERFYGTVVNEEVLKKLQRANELLGMIEAGALSVSVDRFTAPNPHFTSGIVAINVDGVNVFDGTILKFLKELMDMANEITFAPQEERICRIAFSFKNLWKESRLMTDEETEEYWNSFDVEEE